VRGDDGKFRDSIRMARTRRATLVRTLFDEAKDPRRMPANRLAVHAIACELDRIRKYPSRDGAAKEHRFKVVVNREQFQSPT
ncbi:MAG: hypothetical protein ACRCS0_00975, partial [Albidovulum sp.]